MRIEKSAYEKKIKCACGCVFYANKRDFRYCNNLYLTSCPQCYANHYIPIGEYADTFDYSRYRYGEVQIGEVQKAGTN